MTIWPMLHRLIMMIEGIAHLLSESQFGPEIPAQPRARLIDMLIRPYSPLSIQSQIMALPAIGTSVGMKTAAWKKPPAFTFPLRSPAMASARIVASGMKMIANCVVRQSTDRNVSSVSIRR